MKQAELEVLIFCSEKSCYGIDIEQIACLAEPENDAKTVFFEEMMTSNVSPQGRRKWISVKGGEAISISIPEPETLSRLSLCDIRPLPALFEAARSLGVWGLVRQAERLIILVDLYKNDRFKELVREACNKEKEKNK